MKKLFFAFLVCVTFLSSCKKQYRVYEAVEISYKNDLNSNRGWFSAKNGDYIYYFSNESGTAGIHSMRDNGEDIRLICSCEDIAGLQIVNDCIYVSVLQDEKYRGKKVFDIEKYSLDGEKKGSLLNETIYSYYPYGFPGVSGFYLDGEGNEFISIFSYEDKRGIVSNDTFHQKDGVLDSIHEISLDFTTDKEATVDDQVGFYQISNNYVALNNYKPDFQNISLHDPYRVIAEDAYGYNMKDQCSWRNYDGPFNRWNGARKIWGIRGTEMILSKDQTVFGYDMEKKKTVWETEFQFWEDIAYMDVNEEYIDVVTEDYAHSTNKKYDDSCQQTLYRIDSEHKQDIIKVCEIGDRIIYKKGPVVIVYDRETMDIFEIKDDEVVSTWTGELDVGGASIYQMDMAGDWAFVKYCEEENGGFMTVKKIQLPDVLMRRNEKLNV